MTPYYQAWIDLITQRDNFYLYLAAAVLVGWTWYKLFFKRLFKFMAAGAGLVVLAGLIWGIYHTL